MENWNFTGQNETVRKAASKTIRSTLVAVMGNLSEDDRRTVIPLGYGDPSVFPSFKPSEFAERAITEAIRSTKFNGYAPSSGIPQARRALAEHLSCNQEVEVSPDDVHVTAGAGQAIEVIITALAYPGANILLPKPGYPFYEARATFSQLEIRHYDLLPDQAWEVDLHHLESIADDNTIAVVITNPGNPCGNVYTYDHLEKIAEIGKRHGFLVIADEAYADLAFGSTPFTPMRVFGMTVPVLSLGSLSKRWLLPGWRLGWIVITDPNHILQKHGVVDCIKNCLDITPNPATFIQASIPKLLKEIPEEFYLRTVDLLRKAADVCYDKLQEIPGFECPYKPQGSMFILVKLNFPFLEGFTDDMDFCLKLATEESVVLLPGTTMGMKNWLRLTFAVEPSFLEDGLERIQAFCSRHKKQQNVIKS